jgi:hypothetical protein
MLNNLKEVRAGLEAQAQFLNVLQSALNLEMELMMKKLEKEGEKNDKKF